MLMFNFSNIPLSLLISFMAISILGPVTIHICEFLKELSLVQSHAIILSMNSVTPMPVAFLTHKCLFLNHDLNLGVRDYRTAIFHSQILAFQSHPFVAILQYD